MSIQPLEAVTPLPTPAHVFSLDPLLSLVSRAFGSHAPASPAIVAMPGGASTRRYFRVDLGTAGRAVGMFVPDGARPEEVQKQATTPRWPFLEVADLLRGRGIDVPKVLGEATDEGWLLLEDLDDDTLANYLLRVPESKTRLYQRAVTDLAVAQRKLEPLPEGCVVAGRSFDHELLLWEIHHFREWGLEAQGIHLSPADRETFDGIAVRLATRIAAWPRGFVHRDYQSRNLMVRPGERLCWIDFQDALLGPRVYDLVALLNDSYQTFDREFVEARLAEYGAARGLGAEDQAQIVAEFDFVTVQRKLKDAGRFVFIDRVKNNASFLPFVEPTLAKVMSSLDRLAHDSDMQTLRTLLARVLPG